MLGTYLPPVLHPQKCGSLLFSFQAVKVLRPRAHAQRKSVSHLPLFPLAPHSHLVVNQTVVWDLWMSEAGLEQASSLDNFM